MKSPEKVREKLLKMISDRRVTLVAGMHSFKHVIIIIIIIIIFRL